MAEGEAPVCEQIEIVYEVDCCTGQTERVCGQPATWVHVASRTGLCDAHEQNARMYGGAELGKWTVGKQTVSYPDGWERVEGSSDASVSLEIVTFDS